MLITRCQHLRVATAALHVFTTDSRHTTKDSRRTTVLLQARGWICYISQVVSDHAYKLHWCGPSSVTVVHMLNTRCQHLRITAAALYVFYNWCTRITTIKSPQAYLHVATYLMNPVHSTASIGSINKWCIYIHNSVYCLSACAFKHPCIVACVTCILYLAYVYIRDTGSTITHIPNCPERMVL